jgi:DNA transposition AAA+ family ATPase
MKQQIAQVKNVMRLGLAFASLVERDAGVPGIGLVYGFTGAGKSTAIAQLIIRVNGVFTRASAVWTPNMMLQELTHELGGQPGGSNARMLKYCCEVLGKEPTPRAIFVDEADYLLSNTKMLETLRDIHDVTGAPVVLIGMDGIQRKITLRPQFSRRITQWVEFKALDLSDTRTLIDTVCEVAISDDLAGKLHHAAGGSVGLMTVGLARIEQVAKSQGWERVDAKAWGDKQFFLSRAPKA